MRYSHLSCSDIFVCTAILCLDSIFYNYSFFHITKCTPTSLKLNRNVHLISLHNDYSLIQQNYAITGYICSYCTRSNLVLFQPENGINECSKHVTKLKLINYCKYSDSYTTRKNNCQCSSTNESIQPIRNWAEPKVRLGKSHMNTKRVNNINASSYLSYFIIGFVFLLTILGGIIAMLIYRIKLEFLEVQTLK